MKLSELKATAYHEAGHAFADWKFGFKIKRATIVPNVKDGSAGHVQTRTGLHFRSLEYTNPSGARIGRLHERVVSLMAGHAAQARYNPRSVRSHHGRFDRQAVSNLLSRFHEDNELPHVIRYLETRAKNMVENPMNWFVIKYLANELLNRRTMTGEQVHNSILAGLREHASKSHPKLSH